jgi:hypothetical protein
MRLMTAFEQLTSDNQEKVFNFVDYYCKHFNKNSGGIWYKSAVWAKLHLEVLGLLGVSTSNIVLVDINATGAGPEYQSVRRRNWEIDLGIKGRMRWIIAEKRVIEKDFDFNEICIQDIVTVGESRQASYAFRYCMYILRIGYWKLTASDAVPPAPGTIAEQWNHSDSDVLTIIPFD